MDCWNSRFCPQTIAHGSISSLNYENDRSSPPTFSTGSNSSFCRREVRWLVLSSSSQLRWLNTLFTLFCSYPFTPSSFHLVSIRSWLASPNSSPAPNSWPTRRSSPPPSARSLQSHPNCRPGAPNQLAGRFNPIQGWASGKFSSWMRAHVKYRRLKIIRPFGWFSYKRSVSV